MLCAAFPSASADGGAPAVATTNQAVATRSTQSRDRLEFGMSTAMSGPTAALGQNHAAGYQAAFLEVNEHGGVHGRQLELIILDDGYEPDRAAANARALIDRGVLAIVGNVGTPTGVVSRAICENSAVLFYAPFTGAGALRAAAHRPYIVHYRASYEQELTTIVDALVHSMGVGVDEIAFVTQRDAFGDAGFRAGLTAMKRFGMNRPSKVVHGRYARNTTDVENAVADLLLAESRVGAVIYVGTHGPCARLLQLMRANGLRQPVATLSFCDAAQVSRQAGSDGEGMIASQVVPHPSNDTPLARRYRAALDRLNRATGADFTPHHVSFEGYIAARLLIEVMTESGTAIRRSSLVTSLRESRRLSWDGGLQLTLSAGDNQASDRVWLTVIREGTLEAYEPAPSEGRE
jgi:ABC-type branched-subunit amino acid transport system substrate-binding protein